MTDPSAGILSGKVAFIACGTGVIGEAIVRGFAKAGAKVAVGGPEDGRLREVTDIASREGGDVRAVAFDARSVKDIGRAVDGVCDHFWRVDILVNSVGIHREQLLLEATEESYDSVIALNLKAAMFLGQAVARHDHYDLSGPRREQALHRPADHRTARKASPGLGLARPRAQALLESLATVLEHK